MSVIFEQYNTRLMRKRCSPHTVRIFNDAANRLDFWLSMHGLTPESCTVDDLEEYFDQLPLAPSSKNTHLRILRAAYNYAAKRGAIRHNPILDVEEREVDPKGAASDSKSRAACYQGRVPERPRLGLLPPARVHGDAPGRDRRAPLGGRPAGRSR